MKRFLLACAVLMFAVGSAFAQVCVVRDPTGTPLNVRTHPNGRIVGALHNGARVEILETTYDNGGRPWAYIRPLDVGQRGWVFRAYLDCQ